VSDPSAPIVELVSMTGVPAFIARSDLKMMRSQRIREIVVKRLSILEELASIPNWQEAKGFLKNNNIPLVSVSLRRNSPMGQKSAISGIFKQWFFNLRYGPFCRHTFMNKEFTF
jgi:hypothetical protein